MRKLTSILLAAVLLLSCTVTAFAAEADPVEIGVYAKSEYSIDGEYTAPVENGSASATTPDGTVAITNVPDNALTLVVVPMDGGALTWVDGCVEMQFLPMTFIFWMPRATGSMPTVPR